MGEMVSYRSDGGPSQGYLALPSGAETRPAVIVIQEWWGLVPHITTVADRFAEAGFIAFAPDLYRGISTCEPDEAGRLIMGLAMDQAARDIAGAADYLAARADVSGKVGCVGFCTGGSLALWSATLSERIVATAGFYPRLPWERMSPQWANYAGKSAIIHCPENGAATTADGVLLAGQAIEAVGGHCARYDYAGAAHGFFNDDRPESYHPQASATAWARTLELFRAKLG
ncbi:MAG TPA: dienelactone hydrolase family protein [Micromonosporaceae bacterium]|nr:dienelactone hydrolase family protein [Micromonosporaceae bacterium]